MAETRPFRKLAVGHLTLVQETRFRLQTDDGPNVLLTLAHDAPVDAATLERWRADRRRVRVAYTGEPALDSGVAHAVRPA